ncbi:dTDP-glucose 4,6-dehydratase, partial [Streptomyces sp. 2MCAF27]
EAVLRGGTPGEVYNLGGGTDLTGRELTEHLLRICGATWDAVTYVPDRPANDLRYSIDWSKAAAQLGYRPTRGLEDGLAETADWYRRNPDRWAPLSRNPRVAFPALRTAAAPLERHHAH